MWFVIHRFVSVVCYTHVCVCVFIHRFVNSQYHNIGKTAINMSDAVEERRSKLVGNSFLWLQFAVENSTSILSF